MILYFSGTGNSAYVAKQLSLQLKEESVDVFARIRSQDYTALQSNRPWVVVCPTYAWRIPRILQQWLEKTALNGCSLIYFVMTCGDNIGYAEKSLKALCALKQMDFCGCFPIVMPENYIALFTTPGKEEALEIISRADGEIDKAAEMLRLGKHFPQATIHWKDRLSSGIVNDLFYSMFVGAKKFYVTESCISCGQCAHLCPLHNIQMKDGKPVWGKACTHCMACICRCPTEAIEYGKHSRGLPRYVCPK